MKHLYLSLLLVFSMVLAQAADRTAVAGNVNWNTAASWSPSGVPASGDNVIIPAGSNVTLNVGATVSGFTLSGGTLTISSNFALTINGTVTYNSGTINATNGTISYNGSAAGQNVMPGTYFNLTFSNFNKVLSSSGTISISGTFTPGTATGHTITGSTISFNGTGSQTIPSFNYHHLTITGTRPNNNNRVEFATNGTVGIAGTYSHTGLSFTGNGQTGVRYNGTSIDYNGTGAQNVLVNNLYPYEKLIISNNGSGVTTANLSGTTVSILVTGKLYFASAADALSGGASFTLNSGATLGITSPNGITTGTTASGNIQVMGTRTYNAGAHYVYMRNATGTQSTGNGLPAAITGSLNVNLGASANSPLTLSQSTSIATLTLTNGTLSVGANTLTLPGTVVRDGSTQTGSINATTGTILVNGTAAQTIPAGTLSGTVNVFTVNNTSGSTPALTLNGDLSASTLNLTNGVLGIGANTLTLLGGIVRSNGSIKASSGTVVYGGSTAQSIEAALYEGNTIRNLVISNPVTVTQNSSLVIGNDLTLTSGQLLPGTFTLTVGGNIIHGSGSIDASNATLVFNGSTPQTIASAFAGALGNVVINNTSGAASAVTLSAAHTIGGTLTLTSGKLDIGSFDLTVNAGALSGGSAASYVKTSGTGVLKIRNVGSTPVSFPVGNGAYNPLAISNPVTLDWSVRVKDAIENVAAGYQANIAGAVQRQWDITPSINNPAPGEGATITFYYNDSDGGSGFSSANPLQLWHYFQGYWAARGTAQLPTTVGSMKSFTVSGLTYFSPYSLSNASAPLPVSLLSFSGKRGNGVNELKWSTASESNNRGFVVERSNDGRSFERAGFVASHAQGGNSNSELTYSFTDRAPSGGKWYYRLKQEDIDGRSKYSAVVLLTAARKDVLTIEGVYPNPVTTSTIYVRLQAGAQNGPVLLQLVDMQGRQLKAKRIDAQGGAATTATLELGGLAAGQYVVKAVAPDGSVSESLTVVKK